MEDGMALDDVQLAGELKRSTPSGAGRLHVIANAYQVRIFCLTIPNSWTEVGSGDLGNETAAVLNPLLKRKQVSWQAVSGPVSQTTVDETQATVIGPKDLVAWQSRRQVATIGGRTGEADAATMREVAARAGWFCQFAGCGKDLRTHTATGQRGNYSYFAHIVASSEDGPRGDKIRSARLANDPDNFMLLCDECHRLIDRVRPEEYDEQRLQEMRRANMHEVSRLLGSLQYPEAQMLVVMSSVTGQPTYFEERRAEEALWLSRFRRGLTQPEWFCRNGFFNHNPHDDHYWEELLKALRNDIPRLQAMLAGALSTERRKPIAVFPLHSTSVQILAGRLVGDVGGVYPFQFHRDQISGGSGGQWAWPASAPEPAPEKYKWHILRDRKGEKEACLLVSLTFKIGEDRLPDYCAAQGELKLPTCEVTVESPASTVIGHPKDLEDFGRVLDQALRQIQDTWGAKKIHLFVGAPSSACFRVGQKMQARHQATFVCHEAEQGKGPFLPTIEITSDRVLLPKTGKSVELT
jgi:hypothetical protein